MARRRSRDIYNAIVISDTHVGCKVAICHPDGATLDDGGKYYPSAIQNKIWECWEEFWNEWVPEIVQGEPFIVVHNGDAIDGVHHHSTTQWSHNIEDQAEHAYKILKPVVEACEGRYYHIRGTEAHVGQSGVEEERLAKRLGAVPNETGMHARYELWLRMPGRKGAKDHLCHFLHHIGTTSSSQHETSALNAEYAAMCTDAARFGREPPTVIGRSHRHRNSEIRLPSRNAYATVFTTACWQLKTSFAWKIAGARISTPQIGGSIIRQGDQELYTRHRINEIPMSSVVRAEEVA